MHSAKMSQNQAGAAKYRKYYGATDPVQVYI